VINNWPAIKKTAVWFNLFKIRKKYSILWSQAFNIKNKVGLNGAAGF